MKTLFPHQKKIYIGFLLSAITGISSCKMLSGGIGESLANTGRQVSEEWQVIKVSDGDTITVRSIDGRQEKKIRFCGIDAPESKQPLGKESKANLQKLVDEVNGKVMITEVESDRYGRTVAEVFSSKNGGEKFWNEEQLSSGNAYLYSQYANKCPNAVALRNAEAIAKSKKLGVWSGNYQKPWDYRKQQRSR